MGGRIGHENPKSQEPRAKSQEPRAKSQEPRAKSQEPRAKSQEPRYTSDLSLPARTVAPVALSCGRTFLLAVFVLASLVFLSVDNALAQGTVATDRAALVALYDATGGANWTNSANWKTTEPLSRWYGVATDSDGRVTRLFLNFNQLTGPIPAELGDLTNLQRLYLDDNRLSGAIPAELGDLTSLQQLYLDGNDLSGAIPAELGDLTNLQRLYLHENRLSGAIPAELGDLTNLWFLYLDDNRLSGAIPAELGDLTSLQQLYLDGNDLSGAIPAELGDLTNLQRLYLDENRLSGAIPAELGDLTSLQQLYLDGNELSGEIPAELGDLTNLWFLYLDDNRLSGAIPAELGDLTSLLFLDLHENRLSGEIPAELGDLTNLWFLYLDDNRLSGAIPAELGDLTSLQQLYLDGNELSGEIPAELGDLTSLRFLFLSQNELSGGIPAALESLTRLQALYLNHNPQLTGTIPPELENLAQLRAFYVHGTGLCVLPGSDLQTWLATIDFRGSVCVATPPPPPPPPDPPPPPPPPRPPGGGGGEPRTSVPGAPTNLTVVGGNGEVVLSWDAPASDGGAAITDYEYRINRSGPWIPIGSTDTTHTVTGLDNGTEYTFQVRAVNAAGRSASTNRAEATPELFTLDFAHFANGDGITSDLVFVNVGTHPIRPVISFYDQEGQPIAAESVVDITGDLEIQEDGSLSIQTEMGPLGELTISTHGQGDLVSGSVRVISDGPIGGMLRFDLPAIGEAVVGASPPVSDTIFPVRRREGGITTGVAVHNLEEEAMEVSCELLRAGAVLEEVAIPLAANGQTSWLIDQAFPAADTSDFVGSVRCDADGEGLFSAVALEMDPGTRVFLRPCRCFRWIGETAARRRPWTLRISPMGTAPPPIWCS